MVVYISTGQGPVALERDGVRVSLLITDSSCSHLFSTKKAKAHVVGKQCGLADIRARLRVFSFRTLGRGATLNEGTRTLAERH